MFQKFKALFGAQDMTVGSPFMCLLKFVIPLLLGNLAQLLYTTVDAAVVGKYMGDAALSAVGASMPVHNLFLVLLLGLGSGITIMVSQYFGAKDYETLGASIGNSITLIAIVSVFITIVATPLTGTVLNLVKTPTESYDYAKAYLSILFLGTIGNGFYNVLSGILRGLGESVFPLLVLAGTVITNAVLDIVFVSSGMGTAGAAYATIISQAVSAVVCLFKVLKMKGVVQIKAPMLRIRRKIVGQIVHLGLPTALSMGIMFASVMLTQSLINGMGYMVMAAITVTVRLDSYAVLPSQTFAIVASTFTGQNIGAGNMDRVQKGLKTVFVMSFTFTAVMVVSMLLFGRHMMRLFTDSEVLIDMGMSFIKIMCPAYFAMIVNQCLSGVIRGAGDTIGPMWISILINVVLRVPTAFIIAHLTKTTENPGGSPYSPFLSMLAAFIVGAAVTGIYYKKGKWRARSLVKRETAIPEGL